MKRFLATFAVAAVLSATVASNEADAQVTASSYSTGGTAVSTAYGRGNTRLNSSAVASGGGYARSTMTGSGTNGGFASGNSRAVSHGGVAISNGHSTANGWGARSHSNSYARTVYGFARSDSNAVANGTWANARSNAGTQTWGTYGRSSSEAIDNRGTYNTYPVQPLQSVTGPANGAGYSTGTTSSIYQNSTGNTVRFRSGIIRNRW